MEANGFVSKDHPFSVAELKEEMMASSLPKCTKKQGMEISAEARETLFLQLLVEAKSQILKRSSEKAHLRRAELSGVPMVFSGADRKRRLLENSE